MPGQRSARGPDSPFCWLCYRERGKFLERLNVNGIRMCVDHDLRGPLNAPAWPDRVRAAMTHTWEKRNER